MGAPTRGPQTSKPALSSIPRQAPIRLLCRRDNVLLSWKQRNVDIAAVLTIAIARLHFDPKDHSRSAVVFDIFRGDDQRAARHRIRTSNTARDDLLPSDRRCDA